MLRSRQLAALVVRKAMAEFKVYSLVAGALLDDAPRAYRDHSLVVELDELSKSDLEKYQK